MSETLSSIPTGSNILQLDFSLFCFDSVELHGMHLCLGKTQLFVMVFNFSYLLGLGKLAQ